jgi:hypothetical protein
MARMVARHETRAQWRPMSAVEKFRRGGRRQRIDVKHQGNPVIDKANPLDNSQ